MIEVLGGGRRREEKAVIEVLGGRKEQAVIDQKMVVGGGRRRKEKGASGDRWCWGEGGERKTNAENVLPPYYGGIVVDRFRRSSRLTGQSIPSGLTDAVSVLFGGLFRVDWYCCICVVLQRSVPIRARAFNVKTQSAPFL